MGVDNLFKFERGTISYIITATLTRPTTISPTMSAEKRIMLLETIDIAPLAVPKPRVISLEPVSRKTKTRSKIKGSSMDQISQPPPASTDNHVNGSESRPPLSPVPSELSNSSCVSNSTQSFQVVSEPNSANRTSVQTDDIQENSSSLSDKTITATTEILRGGGLPGDALPIKITVSHTKPIRSPNGVIITLYRQGRIDMHPAIPVGTIERGQKPVYEDCYPKSRTGLGGLSFGAARTNSVFRKDLSQTFAPLIVDPKNMTAVVKSSIRIPEDAFPTISRVPGGMISFRYYIEVVMDLRGKLAGLDRFLPKLNRMTGGMSSYGYSPGGLNANDMGRGQIGANWGNNILDTDQIRREKSVVACVFEVTVGSIDSARGQAQTSETTHTQSNPDGLPATPQTVQQVEHDGNNERHEDQSHVQHNNQTIPPHDEYPDYRYDAWRPQAPPDDYVHVSQGNFVPPIQPEEDVDEKTRLRRAEEILLPSGPPQNSEAGPSAAAPSAPVLHEQDSFYGYIENQADQNDLTTTPTITSSPSADTIMPAPYPTSQENSRVPSSSANQSGPQSDGFDDKRELERRRLLAEASAPETSQEVVSSENMRADDATPNNGILPSAPVLTERDILEQPLPSGEALPRYQS